MKPLQILLITLICHCALSVSARNNNSSSLYRIIKGDGITISDAPYQIALYVIKKSEIFFICGGSLIAPDTVLTAAHCTKSAAITARRPDTVLVCAGDTFMDKMKLCIQPKWVKNHPKFILSLIKNDIALIKLKKEFNLTDQITTIPLRKSTVATGTMCMVTGWGRTAVGGDVSKQLKRIYVPIFDKQTCTKRYKEVGIPVYTFCLCAGYEEGGKDVCNGDSGGPLVCDKVLTGIVSYGKGCAEPGFPTVYTEVYPFLDWIENPDALKYSQIFIYFVLQYVTLTSSFSSLVAYAAVFFLD